MLDEIKIEQEIDEALSLPIAVRSFLKNKTSGQLMKTLHALGSPTDYRVVERGMNQGLYQGPLENIKKNDQFLAQILGEGAHSFVLVYFPENASLPSKILIHMERFKMKVEHGGVVSSRYQTGVVKLKKSMFPKVDDWSQDFLVEVLNREFCNKTYDCADALAPLSAILEEFFSTIWRKSVDHNLELIKDDYTLELARQKMIWSSTIRLKNLAQLDSSGCIEYEPGLNKIILDFLRS